MSAMRKFLIKISYTLLPLWLLAVAAVTYFSLCIVPKASGDIGRLVIIPFGHEYDSTLARNYIPQTLFTTIDDMTLLKQCRADVITVGDSFSERGREGYQNYLAQYGLKVVNCERHLFFNPITFAYEIMNLGLIDSINTPVLIVECGERGVDEFMYGFEPKSSLHMMRADKKKLTSKTPNQWSLSRLKDYFVYRSGFTESPIHDMKLDGDFFSYKGDERHLYIYRDDIMLMGIPKHHELIIKQTWQSLLDKAAEKGINLLFVVPVDKYDLYQDHIVDNPYPRKVVNEDIKRIFNDDPHILITRDYLQPLVEQGEKDIFLFNDTHWSYKAAQVVAKEIYRRLDGTNKNTGLE